ncbi:MAG: PIG-L family deacetylase [Thermaerobacter sp.]|nr:PIG-L family deacetylase [Thermaerobacter sp.]
MRTLHEWRDAGSFLFVSPHPDDVELGCGGTLATLARAGAEVHLAVVTDGRLGTRDPLRMPDEIALIRSKEQQAAAKELGAKLRMLGLPDGGPHDYYRLRDRAVALIRDVRPDYVFVCDPYLPYEVHSDHRMVGLAVSEAVLLAGLPHYAGGSGAAHDTEGILYYFPRRATELSPLDEESLARRRRALACHRSQFGRDDQYLERLEAQLRHYGSTAGAIAAEPLHLRRRTELHIPDPEGMEE